MKCFTLVSCRSVLNFQFRVKAVCGAFIGGVRFNFGWFLGCDWDFGGGLGRFHIFTHFYTLLRTEKCTNVYKLGRSVFKCSHTCSTVFKGVQLWIKRVQLSTKLCTKVWKCVQLRTNMNSTPTNNTTADISAIFAAFYRTRMRVNRNSSCNKKHSSITTVFKVFQHACSCAFPLKNIKFSSSSFFLLLLNRQNVFDSLKTFL